jgi:uncharacterized damage-inducible protein DinB
MKELINTYLDYNLWANKRITAVVTSINPSLYDVEVKSSFPSLRKTVHHIWDAELAWLARLKKEVVSWPPSAQFKDPAIDDFLKTSDAFVDYVKSKGDNFLSEISPYKDSKGAQHSNLHSEMIMHCMNHSTYHRGQLVTILRGLGVTEIPSTDLITWYRSR